MTIIEKINAQLTEMEGEIKFHERSGTWCTLRGGQLISRHSTLEKAVWGAATADVDGFPQTDAWNKAVAARAGEIMANANSE